MDNLPQDATGADDAPDASPVAPQSDDRLSRLNAIRTRRKRLLARLAATLVITVAGLASLGAYWVSQIPSVEALAPADASCVATYDYQWAWDVLAPVRRQPEVVAAMAKASRSIGLSIDGDIAPWIGRMAIVSWGNDKTGGTAALIRVRDWLAFGRCLARLRSVTASRNGARWSAGRYKDRALQHVSISAKLNEPITCDIAFVHGWVVVGLTPHAIDHIIDVYEHRAPSLSSNQLWRNTTARLPKEPVASFWADVPMISDDYLPSAALARKGLSIGEAMWFTDLGNGLRADSLFFSNSPKAEALIRRLRGNSPPVSGRILAQMPNAVVALLFNDPQGWWRRIGSLAEYFGTPADVRKFQRDSTVRSISAALDGYSGECGVGLLWKPGQGFGAVAIATADTPRAPVASARRLKNAFRSARPDAAQLAEYTGHAPKSVSDLFPYVPTVRTSGTTLLVATDPQWLADTGEHPQLSMPPDSDGCSFVEVGTLRPLNDLFAYLRKTTAADKTMSAKDRSSWLEGVTFGEGLGVQNASWAQTVRFDPDGRFVQQTQMVYNWDWRQAFSLTVDLMARLYREHPAGGSVDTLVPTKGRGRA